jgi:crotonobetainyl-CoA:carnitine CoA-transferase CaiB-like acyl-CoA transferase
MNFDHLRLVFDDPAVAAERRTTKEWLARLEAAGVPAGPIRTLDEVFSDQQVLTRGLESAP